MEIEELRTIIHQDPGKLLQKLKDKTEADKLVGLLWEIAASTEESKEIKKAAKKALYTIRSSGIDVNVQKPQKRVQKKEGNAEEIDQAVLSLPDSKDNYMFFISTSNSRTLSLDIHQILLHSLEGVLDYRVEGMSRRSFEKFKTESKDIVPVPTPYALSRLNRAMKLSSAQKLKSIPEILKGRREDVTHPVLSLAGTRISRIQSLSDEKKVFAERELGRITLSADDVTPFREQIEQAMASRLIIDNMSPEQRVENIISRFCQAYFTEERRTMYCEYLFDIAFYYYYNEKEQYVTILIEYGKRLMNMSADIKAHPFVQFLIYKDFLQRG